ncbi:MAG: flagellar hook assembly protein FlgD [Ferrovibrio sp.]|uniref:flagellar hook assembly protein FlgD n=1 Tax=Ferrovibrio sp. TaxID=1917215 RepID=UPI00391B262F
MVTSVSSTTGTTTTTNSASAALASDFDTFLTLLTMQLKNQDPTDPMDPNEFTEQLVQFSQVEQQINMNSNLETIIAQLQTQQTSANLGYIGKVVDVNSTEGKLVEGGTVFWSYELPEGTTSVQYNILDEDGNVMRTVNAASGDDGFVTGSRIEISWDGTDASGNVLEAGTYTLQVTAKDASGAVLDGTKVYARGYVEAVETIDGEQFLIVSGMQVSPSDVVSVFATSDTSSNEG